MTLAFRKYGNSRPLLILHGLFGQSDNWNTLAKKFSERNLEVFAIDLRNHGLSPHSNNFSYREMAEDIFEFVKLHGLEKAILLGHSMGGKVAMFAAQLKEELFQALIVADMAPVAYPPHHDEVLKALQSIDFERVQNRKAAEEILSKSISDFGTRQFLLKNIYYTDPEAGRMAWRFNLGVITEKYNEILAEVPNKVCRIHTLFIKGEKSNYISDTYHNSIFSRFPLAEIITIPGAGHWVHADQPELFFAAAMKHIESIPNH